jgi:hypothetical protein
VTTSEGFQRAKRWAPSNGNPARPKGIRMNTADHYRRIRREHPTLSAGQAIGWARHELAIDRFLFDIGWEDTRDQAPFMIANLPDGQIRVFWDDEPYEWGDIEPSDFDRSRCARCAQTTSTSTSRRPTRCRRMSARRATARRC